MNDVTFNSDEFYISYLDKPDELANVLDFLCSMAGRPEPTGQSETALCIKEDSKTRFLILYGDHREAYRKLAPDLGACIKYFTENIDKISHSSDSPEAVTH